LKSAIMLGVTPGLSPRKKIGQEPDLGIRAFSSGRGLAPRLQKSPLPSSKRLEKPTENLSSGSAFEAMAMAGFSR